MSSDSARRRDVQWPKDALGDAQPAWSTEPSLSLIEGLARRYLNIPPDVPCSVSLFAQGGFNKLYAVDIPGHAYLMRVALPVEPTLKTSSEVATIQFVRIHATGLVPCVLAYEADAGASGLGFEWMIMEKLPGDILASHWQDMHWEAKVALVKTVAGVLSRLYDRPLSGIGNIFPDPVPVPGRIVSMLFFWDDHYEQDVPRGPFRCSHDWLQSCLQFILNDVSTVLARSIVEDDEDEHEEAAKTRSLAERLLKLLPRVFPPSDTAEPTIIHHDDLSSHNLLVSPTGELTGIIDWECVSALPLWYACSNFPSFLQGRTRTERPVAQAYAKDEQDASKPTALYFEHLLDWEKTRLRDVFLEEMTRLRPEWARVRRESVLRADFYSAVHLCDSEMDRRRVREWVDRVEMMSDEELALGRISAGYRSLD